MDPAQPINGGGGYLPKTAQTQSTKVLSANSSETVNPSKDAAASGRADCAGAASWEVNQTNQTNRRAVSFSSVSTSNVSMQVNQLFQDLGLDSNNNKLLQLMIALMILSALLKDNSEQKQSADSPLSKLGSSQAQSMYLSESYYSSTTRIEQSTITSTYAAPSGDATESTCNANGSQNSGQQLDVTG